MNTQKERFNFKRPEVVGRTPKAQKERKSVNFRIVKNILYLVILSLGCYILIFSNVFEIKTVKVSGVKSVEISDYLNQTLIGKNILLMQTGKYLDGLAEKFPILQEAQLVRGLPSTVKITVHERTQVLILCNNQSCYEVDSRGYAYQEVSRPKGKIILIDEKNIAINQDQKIFSESFIKFYLDAIDEFNNIGVFLKEARMDETTFKIKFVSAEGWYAILDSSENLKNQISAVDQVLKNYKSDLHEYVDVRVEGTTYIK